MRQVMAMAMAAMPRPDQDLQHGIDRRTLAQLVGQQGGVGHDHGARNRDQHRPRSVDATDLDRGIDLQVLALGIIDNHRLARRDHLRAACPGRIGLGRRAADGVGIGAVGDDQAAVVDDCDRALAVIERLADLACERLEKVEIVVGPGNAVEHAVDHDRHRHGGQIDLLALNDIGQGAEQVFAMGVVRVDVPRPLTSPLGCARCCRIRPEAGSRFSAAPRVQYGRNRPVASEPMAAAF
jgi:hypothetical protein